MLAWTYAWLGSACEIAGLVPACMPVDHAAGRGAAFRLSWRRVPRPNLGAWSTYTVLGLIGYVVGATVVGSISVLTAGPVLERLLAITIPAFGFWFAVSITRTILGFEQIVFYEAAGAAWAATMVAGLVAGLDPCRLSDLVVVLIASFNTFGRIGCYHVACCHGRPARIGVRYGHEHARLGFPRRWVGRALVPIQLAESVASAALALAGAALVLAGARGGTATIAFVDGYALVRFACELARGDSGRPYWRGLSEAQWIAVASSLVVFAARPTPTTFACALALVTVAPIAAWRNARVAFRNPRHLDELERAHANQAGAFVVTSRGFEVSTHVLDDGRVDLVWAHPLLSLDGARILAADLFTRPDVIAGSRGGLYHVIVEAGEAFAQIRSDTLSPRRS